MHKFCFAQWFFLSFDFEALSFYIYHDSLIIDFNKKL